MSLGALIQAAPGSSSRSGSISSGGRLLIGNVLAAALSSLSQHGVAEALISSAEGDIVPRRTSADALTLLVQGIMIRTTSSTNLAASQQGSVAAAAADTFSSGRSMMELLHETLGSSSGNSAARPGGGPGSGARILRGAPRAAGTGMRHLSGIAGPSAMVAISRSGSGLLDGDERFMGSRAERWQAALLTSANASRMTRDAEAAAERRMKKGGNALRSGGNSRVQSSGHVMFSAEELHHPNDEGEPDRGVEGWEEEGDIELPGFGSGRHLRAHNVPRSGACPIVDSMAAGSGVDAGGSTAARGNVDEGGCMGTGGSTSAGGSTAAIGSMDAGGSEVAESRVHVGGGVTSGGHVAAEGDTSAGGGMDDVGCAADDGDPMAAASSESPQAVHLASTQAVHLASTQAVHLASSTIATLAAKAQAAHLVGLLAVNQQLLTGSWATVDASARSSPTAGSAGGQRPTAGSDNTSRMSDAPSSTTRRPSSSQRDNASRRLSALLIEMRPEAEGLGGGAGSSVGMQRQRRRSDVMSAGSDGSRIARLMGPPPTPDELAAAALSLDIEVSGSAAVRSSPAATRWKNIFRVERRPFRPFCQPPSSSGPLCRVPAPDDHDAQSIAEEASN